MDSSPPDFSHLRLIQPRERGTEKGDESTSAMLALKERERELHEFEQAALVPDWLATYARQEEQLRAVFEINQATSSVIDLALGRSSVIEALQRSHGPDAPFAQFQHLRETEDRIQALFDMTRRYELFETLGSPGIDSQVIDRDTPKISIPDWMVKGPRTVKRVIKEAVQEAMREDQPATCLPPPIHEHVSATPCSPALEPTTSTPSAGRSGDFRLSQITVIEAPPADRAHGLIGYVSCIMNDAIHIDGVALRKTREGEYSVSFPKKPGRSGDQHFYFKPINEAMRQEFLRQVLAAQGLER